MQHVYSWMKITFTNSLVCAALMGVAIGAVQAEPRRSGLFEEQTQRYEATRVAIKNGQWQLALDALTHQSTVNPSIQNEAEFHNLKGYALRQSDVRQLPLAIEHYLKALAIDPAHVEAREYLGQAHILQGRVDLAEQQLQAIERYCQGQSCEAWIDLEKAIAATKIKTKNVK